MATNSTSNTTRIPVTKEELEENDKTERERIKKERKEAPLFLYDKVPYPTYPIMDKNTTTTKESNLSVMAGSVYSRNKATEYRIDHYHDITNPEIPLKGLYDHKLNRVKKQYYQKLLNTECLGQHLSLFQLYYFLSVVDAHITLSYSIDVFPTPVFEFPFYFKDRPSPTLFRYARIQKVPRPEKDMMINSEDRSVTQHMDRYEIYLNQRYTVIEELRRIRLLNNDPFDGEKPNISEELLERLRRKSEEMKRRVKRKRRRRRKKYKVEKKTGIAIVNIDVIKNVEKKKKKSEKIKRKRKKKIKINKEKTMIKRKKVYNSSELEDDVIYKGNTRRKKGESDDYFTIKDFNHLSPFFSNIVKEYNRSQYSKLKRKKSLRMPHSFFQQLAYYYNLKGKKNKETKYKYKETTPPLKHKSHKELLMPNNLFVQIDNLYEKNKRIGNNILKKIKKKAKKKNDQKLTISFFKEISNVYKKKETKNKRKHKKERQLSQVKRFNRKRKSKKIRSLRISPLFLKELNKAFKASRKNKRPTRKLEGISFDATMANAVLFSNDMMAPVFPATPTDNQIPKLLKTYYYEDQFDIFIFSLRGFYKRLDWSKSPSGKVILSQWKSLILNLQKYHALNLLVINITTEQICYTDPKKKKKVMICDLSGMILANQPDRLKLLSRFVAPEVMKETKLNIHGFPFPRDKIVSFDFPVDIYALGFYVLRQIAGIEIYTRNNEYINQECFTRKCYKDFRDLFETQRMTFFGLDPMEKDEVTILKGILKSKKFLHYKMIEIALTMIAYDDFDRPSLEEVNKELEKLNRDKKEIIKKLKRELKEKLKIAKQKKKEKEEKEKQQLKENKKKMDAWKKEEDDRFKEAGEESRKLKQKSTINFIKRFLAVREKGNKARSVYKNPN